MINRNFLLNQLQHFIDYLQLMSANIQVLLTQNLDLNCMSDVAGIYCLNDKCRAYSCGKAAIMQHDALRLSRLAIRMK
jgi:hypothetical protein